MPRRRIVFHAGEYYHVLNRGVADQPIFFRPQNYHYFIRLLLRKARQHAVALAAYCLMPSHFHLLIRPANDGGVAPFLAGVCGSYAQAINAQRCRAGALFQGRFRATHVDRDAYLRHVARYVHLNPVAAGLALRPQDWPYSNYRAIISGNQAFCSDEPLFGGLFETPLAYRRFVEALALEELPGSLKLPGS